MIVNQQIASGDGGRTRAQIVRDSVEIRLAMGNGAGQMIAQILAENDIELPSVDWSGPLPNWLLACQGDLVIGCVMVLPARPVGFCEFLYVKPSAGFKLRAIAIRKLIAAGMTTCYHAGASYVSAAVVKENSKFRDVLLKLNITESVEATLMFKRLR